MSGPKCAEISVEENLRLIVQARARAWDAVRGTEERLRILLARSQRELGPSILEHRMSVARPRGDARPSEVEAYAAALRQSLMHLENGIERAAIVRQTALMLSAVAASLAGKLTSAEEAIRQRSSKRASAAPIVSGARSEARQDQIRRIMGRLHPRTPDSELLALKELAAESLATPESARFDSLAVEMHVRVQNANHASRARDVDAARAAELIAKVRGLDGEAIEDLRAELRAVEERRQELAPDISNRLAKAEEEAKRRADQNYAAEVIREEFERLGYEVQEGFETLFVSGGVVNVRKPSMNEYCARLEASAGGARLDVRLVRAGEASESGSTEQRLLDREAEEGWCGDFAQILSSARKRKVNHRVVRHVRPGGEPVQVVETEQSDLQRRRVDELKVMRRE